MPPQNPRNNNGYGKNDIPAAVEDPITGNLTDLGLNDMRVLTEVLLNGARLETEAATAYTYRPIGRTYCNLGQHVESIRIYAVLRNKSANFAFKIIGLWSIDMVDWTPFSNDVLAPQTSEGSVLQIYNVATDFGPHIRFLVGTTDTGSRETGSVMAAVSFKFWGK